MMSPNRARKEADNDDSDPRMGVRAGILAPPSIPGSLGRLDRASQRRSLDKPILDLDTSVSQTYGRRERQS